MIQALNNLMTGLGKLPGVGKRSAERMAMKLLTDPSGKILDELIKSLQEAQESLCCCSRCGSITSRENDPCRLCTDARRDSSVVCVVEDPSDIVSIEQSGGYRGRYHALMGKLSPMKGQGPRDVRIRQLIKRVESESFREVILALSTTVEGDSTAAFISEFLKGKQVKITRLAFGLPAGSGILYSDPVTLSKAIRGRTES